MLADDMLPAAAPAASPREGFSERQRTRLPTLPTMNDPARPSTGAGRQRSTAGAANRSRLSEGDFNNVMEQMLSNARKSYGEQIRSRPSFGVPHKANGAGAL
jgi:hypothetical protein